MSHLALLFKKTARNEKEILIVEKYVPSSRDSSSVYYDYCKRGSTSV